MLLRAVIYPRSAQVFHLCIGWDGFLVCCFFLIFFFPLNLCEDLLESYEET